MQKNNLHLKMLSMLSDRHYNNRMSERDNKEAILDHYGLINHSSSTVKKSFNVSDKIQIERFLYNECKNNRYCSVLVHTGRNESIGGCKVFYVMSKEEIHRCLDSLGSEDSIKIYSRKKSINLILSDFDNYRQKEVCFGGGFRIQVNRMRTFQDKSALVFLICASFDNFGSRVLSERAKLNSGPPIKNLIYEVPIIDSNLAPQPFKKASIKNYDTAENAVLFIIGHLLAEKGAKINCFLKDLLSIRPTPSGIHQIEGMYGVGKNMAPVVEIIDFDGIDTFDIGRLDHHIRQTPQEKLFGYQLENIGFIERNDIDAMSTYFMQEAEIERAIQLIENTNFPKPASLVIEKLGGESLHSYFSRLKPYIYTARILECLKFTNNTIALKDEYKITEFNENIKIYWLDIAGIKLAFLSECDKLIHFSSEDCARKAIMHIFGSNILPVYLSYAREGD